MKPIFLEFELVDIYDNGERNKVTINLNEIKAIEQHGDLEAIISVGKVGYQIHYVYKDLMKFIHSRNT